MEEEGVGAFGERGVYCAGGLGGEWAMGNGDRYAVVGFNWIGTCAVSGEI